MHYRQIQLKIIQICNGSLMGGMSWVVIPAEAEIQYETWIPAFAGMTNFKTPPQD